MNGLNIKREGAFHSKSYILTVTWGRHKPCQCFQFPAKSARVPLHILWYHSPPWLLWMSRSVFATAVKVHYQPAGGGVGRCFHSLRCLSFYNVGLKHMFCRNTSGNILCSHFGFNFPLSLFFNSNYCVFLLSFLIYFHDM